MRILPLLETLNRSLQSKTMTVSGMMEVLECVKEELREKRSQNEFNVLFARVNTCAEDLDLEPLRVPRPRKVPARFTGNGAEYHATTAEEYFRPKYFELADHTIQQLEARFSLEDLHTYSSL